LTIVGTSITASILIINGYLLYDVFRQTFFPEKGGGGTYSFISGMIMALLLVGYYLLTAYFAVGE
jgi:hypothetical protein